MGSLRFFWSLISCYTPHVKNMWYFPFGDLLTFVLLQLLHTWSRILNYIASINKYEFKKPLFSNSVTPWGINCLITLKSYYTARINIFCFYYVYLVVKDILLEFALRQWIKSDQRWHFDQVILLIGNILMKNGFLL